MATCKKRARAIKADDYAAAQPVLDGVKERLEQAIASLDAAMSAQSRETTV